MKIKPPCTLLILLALTGCGASGAGRTPGTEGSDCYPNGTCNDGLMCLSNLCVVNGLPDTGPGPDVQDMDGYVEPDGTVIDSGAPDLGPPEDVNRCGAINLGSRTGEASRGAVPDGQASARRGSCGGDGPEQVLIWTAPSSGTWTFDTVGSVFGTVLYVLDGACTGAELGCNDDFETTSHLSRLPLMLAAGQRVTVVVDAYTSRAGGYVLNINGGTTGCDATDLGAMTGEVARGTTVGLPMVSVGSCGGNGPERRFLFTPSTTGTYTIDTVGSTFDTVLYVFDGACMGSELGCNDDVASGNTISSLDLMLIAGRRYTIVVDGYSGGGDFVLRLSGGMAARCGDGRIDPGERCDGAAIGTETCITQGFPSGTLRCLGDCSGFDTAGCVRCGNHRREGTEVCDGTDLASQTCVARGFSGGTLACSSDCRSFSTGGCTSTGTIGQPCRTGNQCVSRLCGTSSRSPMGGYCTNSCSGSPCPEGAYTVCVTGSCYKKCGPSGYGDCYVGQTCIGSSRDGYYCAFPP